MAVALEASQPLIIGHLVASADLSTHQHKFVKLGPSGVALVSATIDRPIGVLLNKPLAGQPCTIMCVGVVAVIAGAAGIVDGDPLHVTAAGLTSEVATSTRVGVALETAVNGKLFTALISCTAAVAGTV